MTSSKSLAQLRSRIAFAAWWAQVQTEHPMGVVPLAACSRVLGVFGVERKSYVSASRGIKD